MTTASDGGARATLERVRTDPSAHVAATAAAVVVGLVLSWVHWAGLIVAGAMLGLVARTLPRAVAASLGFGVVVLVAFAVSLGDAAPSVVEMAPIVYVVVASAFGLPVLGALVRGVV